MPLRIRHFYRKAVIYGILLVASFALIFALAYAGAGWGVILLIFGTIIACGICFYLLFDPVAALIFHASPLSVADAHRVVEIVDNLRKNIGLKQPGLAVIHDSSSDIFTCGPTRDHTTIFFTSGSMTTFNDAEIETILKHEIEKIDEGGSIVYTLAMAAYSLLAKLIGRSQSYRRKAIPRGMAENCGKIRIADMMDVPFVVRLMIAHDMYNYFNLHDLSRLARERSSFFLIVYDEDEPAGFIVGEIDGKLFRRRGHIAKLIVDEEHRKKGLGTCLVEAFIDRTRDYGCDQCHIEVRMDNPVAISLYERSGFKKERTITKYYPDGTDCLILVKNLVII
ncbi:MAG TPA: GNAT family N-acetyltransferase [Methanocella sp.]|uniref:GNAT family N-acetyltransferase n=1 Tax=Methanocella sp. TaxID=2052833 RepID=UPI002BC7DFD9|nr:GNAT family N-acetyltransferase [Methanocella sp.]HTY91877.1 GNAT family N-acetyltransferase [Methanocella sp.]